MSLLARAARARQNHALLPTLIALVHANAGGVYNPGDITTLFQDSAGTTPVTADGDPVGKMLDISGNGNHLIQATSTARPTYKIVGGRGLLRHDGIDDILVSSNTFTLSLPLLLVAAINRTGSGSAESYFTLSSNSTNHASLGGTTGSRGRSLLRNTARGALTANQGTGTLGAGLHVISGLNITGTTDVAVDNGAITTASNTWSGDTVASCKIGTGAAGPAAANTAFDSYGGACLIGNPSASRAIFDRCFGILMGLQI